MAVAQMCQHGTLVNGTKDKHLRNPSSVINRGNPPNWFPFKAFRKEHLQNRPGRVNLEIYVGDSSINMSSGCPTNMGMAFRLVVFRLVPLTAPKQGVPYKRHTHKQEEPGNPKANQPNSPRHVDPIVFRLKGPKANQDLSCSQLGNQPQNREQPRLKPDWQPAACALTKHREKGKGTGET